jgi:hypothetical protein
MLRTFRYAKIKSSGEVYAVEFLGDEITKVCGPFDQSDFSVSVTQDKIAKCEDRGIGWLENKDYDWMDLTDVKPPLKEQFP